MRKGYVYALEGVIASLIVLLYLGNIVSVPQQTDWDTTDLSTRSGDIIQTLDASGALEEIIVNNDQQRLDAALQAMDTGLDYNMWISGLPRPTIEVRIAATSDMIQRTTTTDSGDTRTGTLTGIGDFEIRDERDEAVFKYDSVYFDYNDDGTYEEGPCRFGDMLSSCTAKPSGLADQRFQLGYLNETVTVFELTPYEAYMERSDLQLDQLSPEIVFAATDLRERELLDGDDLSSNGDWLEGSFDLDGVTVDLNVTSARDQIYFDEGAGYHGPYLVGDEVDILGTFYAIESLDPVRLVPQQELVADVMFLHDHDPSMVQTHNSTLYEFVSDGNTLIEMADLSGMGRQAFNTTIRQDLGMAWVDVPVQGGSSGSYFPDAEPGTAGSFIKQYYTQVGVTIPEDAFETDGGEQEASFSVGGDDFIARVDTSNDEVGFAPEGDTVTSYHERNDRVAVGSNLFQISNLMPLELTPRSPVMFPDLRDMPVTGDTAVLEDPAASWDQRAASINVSDLSEAETPLEDLPDTVCDDAHLVDDLSIDQTYTVVLSKVTQDADECDDTAYTHVSFDFNDDGASNLSIEATGEGYTKEGIYLPGEVVEINHREYRLFSQENGTWLYFERIVPETVPAASWSNNAADGSGNYMLTGTAPWDNDVSSFLLSATLRGGVERYQLTDSRIIGDTSVGASYTFALDQTVFSPYTIDSVWWYN